MDLNRKQQWMVFAIINGFVLAVLLAFPIYCKYVMNLPTNKCGMVEILHLYCPGCGGTRAFGALLEFDILASFKYNPIVPIGAGIFIAYEAVMIKHLILKTDRNFFVRPWWVYIVLAIWGIYFIVRNVLLFYGIDLIGDIIV